MSITEIAQQIRKLSNGTDEQVCIRFHGLDTDIWCDSEMIVDNLSPYVWLESALDDEDYQQYIEAHDYEIVDTDGELTSALYKGHGFISWDELATAFEMDLTNEVIAAGLEIGLELDDLDDKYEGHFDSDEDWAWEYIESTGMLSDVPDTLKNYFDVERWARDAMMDMSKNHGHYFRNH